MANSDPDKEKTAVSPPSNPAAGDTGPAGLPSSPLGIDNPNPQPPVNKKNPLVPLLVAGAVLLLILGAVTLTKKQDDSTNNATKEPAVSQNQQAKAIQSAASVAINAQGFTPATIKIKKGQSVTWINTDNKPHQPATDPYPSEDGLPGFKAEEPLNKNDTFSFTFDKPGSFAYHDRLNPIKVKGTVVVE